MIDSPRAPHPWWLALIVIVGSVLLTAGGVIALVKPAMLVSAGDDINGAVHIYAGYLASRNLALALMLVAMLRIRAQAALRTLLLLTALVQFLDAGIDTMEARWTIVPGVLALGVAFFVGASRLSVQPLWKTAAWRDGLERPATR